jgi:DNA repair protein RadC
LESGDDELARLGLTPVQRKRLLSCAEIARRHQPRSVTPSPIAQPGDALPHLEHLRNLNREALVVLLLDSRLSLIESEIVATGSLAGVIITPREVFAPALRLQAAAVLIAHNHPSGVAEPSPEDQEFTRVMTAAGHILEIEVVDHLIVARRGYFSFRETGRM